VMLIAFAQAAIAVTGCLTSAMPVSEASCDEHQQPGPDEFVCRTHLQAESQTLDFAKLPRILHFDAPVLTLTPAQALAPVAVAPAVSGRRTVAGAPPPPLIVLYSRSLT
jgi:hypothetical protein